MSTEYEIGYGKPPLHSRFRPGQSGNPRGRPKGALGLKATLRKVLGQTVTVREGEVVRRVTRLEAVLLSLIARALKGDAKAIATVLELSRLVEQDEAPEPVAEGDSAKQELASRLDKIAARLAAAQAPEDETDAAGAPAGQARSGAGPEPVGSAPHEHVGNAGPMPHGRAGLAYAGAQARDAAPAACYRRPGPVGARAGPAVTELA